MHSSLQKELFEITTLSLSKRFPLSFFTPPTATAMSWSLIEGNTGELLWGQDMDKRLEIASLTKIMTVHAVISIFQLLGENLCQAAFEVIAQVPGTTAGLVVGDRVKVLDLLYGLLLPSGNDAAVCLAEGCGKLVASAWAKNTVLRNAIRKNLYPSLAKSTEKVEPVRIFVQCMNTLAAKLGLARTGFSNPTGLADKANKSTSADVARLVHLVRKNALVAAVVRTKQYKCEAKTKYGVIREYHWKNTNVLLNEGYDGFKTGITASAGPCLVATRVHRDIPLIIAVLNCRSLEDRRKDANTIYYWAAEVIDHICKNCEGKTLSASELVKRFIQLV
eukprot:TRINITY_DN4936_c0_g4_i2.p1 TRINITY_DN4936_c0_g4~~TRINITY_DN4936_c0_g4_i2.p1  ORF type:complete len:334 (-),score=60.66 TRINITY_DN4936_c0_g4_i2:103-1104(-)